MFGGGLILARVSASHVSSQAATQGIAAALGAGVLWGTMYIPYRKAYLSGMNPLSFVSFFTIGELGMMAVLSAHYIGGVMTLWQQLKEARHLLFWLLAAGFVWVIGDIFQQYAVKYIGVSRGYRSRIRTSYGDCCGVRSRSANLGDGATRRWPARFMDQS